jgi:hypothetical protein
LGAIDGILANEITPHLPPEEYEKKRRFSPPTRSAATLRGTPDHVADELASTGKAGVRGSRLLRQLSRRAAVLQRFKCRVTGSNAACVITDCVMARPLWADYFAD